MTELCGLRACLRRASGGSGAGFQQQREGSAAVTISAICFFFDGVWCGCVYTVLRTVCRQSSVVTGARRPVSPTRYRVAGSRVPVAVPGAGPGPAAARRIRL